jgi:Fe2+ transport system protein B
MQEGRHGMYGWIWRHLPGNLWVKAFISLVLVLAVVYVLFQYVFPWAEPLLPFNDVTVDQGTGAAASAGVVVR